MKNNFEDLKLEMRDEILSYLTRKDINLNNINEIEAALDDFISDVIVDYMDSNNLELGYIVTFDDDMQLKIDIWEW